ncbi:DUF2927 domain-containing protein [Actibacterium ureilyticum]|uniref:DUF2927 domain-containing protein n=1 Tax=Actibacterium ureilyticum TaxID=1590614 RepID=UPI000BAAA08B|nr:DUF2927 domain-containing protein [Actibacterium ureilyticum]
MRIAVLLLAGVLAGCAPLARDTAPPVPAGDGGLPPMKTFAPARPAMTPVSNLRLAQDFLDLSFQMESGRNLRVMTRFEGPITLRVTGRPAPTLSTDLNALLQRLRQEAGIAITRVPADQPASITIESLPRAQLQRLVPRAACFVAPRVDSWDAYRRARRSDLVDWAALSDRTQVAIFLPGDVSPQEVRDCLHEELAQALGPLNDLYRLPESVFNDDNFHNVLTGYDMLILRTYYAPELHNGMTREQAAARVPGILARLNPRGQGLGGDARVQPTPRTWIDAIEQALGPRMSNSRRRAAAARALGLARGLGWRDNRLGFSLFAQGRLNQADDTDLALASFVAAQQVFLSDPATRLHAAHVAMHLAAYALTTGEFTTAIAMINDNLAPVMEGQNAALLATMLMIKAEALEATDRPAEARAVRLDSLGWARYGFGSETEIRSRLREVAALNPKGST